MNPKKYWILTSLATFILLPLWLNGGLLLIVATFDAKWVLLAPLLLVLTLPYALYAFGKKGALPDTFLSRYGPFIAPIVLTLAAWLLFTFITFIRGGDFTESNSFTNIVASIPLAVFLPFFVFFAFSVLAGVFWALPIFVISSHLFFILCFAVGTWRGKRFKTRGNKKALHALTLILALASVAAIQDVIQYQSVLHDDPDHPEFLEEHWRIEEDYAPFSRQSRLVSPGTPPSLQIDRDYPRLDGAVAFFPVYAAIANAIYKDKEGNGDRKESVGFSATSPEAYTALLEGRVDMIFALVPSVEQEQEAAAQGLTFILTPIAREAFVFLVNEQNPVKNLAVEQIRAIYSGQINNWREVGGPSGKIMAFQRNAGSGSQTTMLRHVMRGTPMRKPLKGEYFSGMGGIIRRVADYRNLDHALGYSFRFYATTLNSIPGIRLLAVDGVLPNVENIRDGSYPFTVDIYIVTARPLSENAQKLRDWLLSAEGQQLIADVGYTPLASDVR